MTHLYFYITLSIIYYIFYLFIIPFILHFLPSIDAQAIYFSPIHFGKKNYFGNLNIIDLLRKFTQLCFSSSQSIFASLHFIPRIIFKPLCTPTYPTSDF